jgi:proteasome lid subunit RPN8/RPN11
MSSPTQAESKNTPNPNVRADAYANIEQKELDELEHSAAFRKAARNAWRATWNGTARYETGFSIDQNGRPGELQSSEFASYDRLSHVAIISKSNALGTFHIHNNYGDPRPSKLDINIAKTTRKIVYVGSRDGLYSVDPNGNVRHLFSSPNWFDKV